MLQHTSRTFFERYFLIIIFAVMIVIVVTFVAGAATLQQTLSNRDSDSHVVNIAGRQRMLSQRITKLALLVRDTDNVALQSPYVNQLDDALDLWVTSHNGLRFGDSDLDLPGDNSDEVNRLYNSIQSNYEIMVSSGRCVVAIARNDTTQAGCNNTLDNFVGNILQSEEDFLIGMNRIVFQYDEEANIRNNDSQSVLQALFIVMVVMLIGGFFGIFIPIGVSLNRTTQRLLQNQDYLQEQQQSLIEAQVHNANLARNLETVVEINTRVATTLNIEQLLSDVSDLTNDNFGFYHTQIYLMDHDNNVLILSAGTGFVGEVMVAEGKSISLTDIDNIVARTARALNSTVINNVRNATEFTPNPLLPNTQSQLAVPLISRGQLLGVLDIQSDKVDFFTSDLVRMLEVAGIQISTALSNASLFQSLQQISSHERALGSINRAIETASSIDQVLQSAVRELGKALRVPHTAIEVQLYSDDPTTNNPNGY